jgi:hypothetical protein
MNAQRKGRLSELLRGESGQVLQWAALSMVGLIGLCGLTIDGGRAYVAHSQMQNYANAAALAAAWQVYDSNSTASVTNTATSYSASSGDKNYTSNGGAVTTTVSLKCLNSLLPSGSKCITGSPNNAVVVKQTVTVPMTFMKLFGVSQLSVTSTATASMQGASQPWNVAIILDATGSMGTTDSNCSGVTEFQCATNGIEALLAAVNPCPIGVATCTASSSNFHVALFSFPAVSTATVGYDYDCSYNTPYYTIYPLPIPGATSYPATTYTSGSGRSLQSFTSTYEITYGASDADANGFLSNYYSTSASNHLNSSSSIVKAVSGCMSPIQSAGWGTGAIQGAYSGGITYYAGAVYAAQSALIAEKTLYPKAKNAIIFLSDGQANLVTSTGDFPTSFTPSPSGSADYLLTSTGYYPSATDECQQAILAAQAATTAGTTVFGVAYGSEQTGCSSGSGATDTTLIATGHNQSFSSVSQLTPCMTIENMASSLGSFYSDWNQSGSGLDNTCVDNSHSVVSLQDIFLSIASNFTTPRLLPNSAT